MSDENGVRTVEQIRERLKVATQKDVLGMALGDLQVYLQEQLKEGATPEMPPTAEKMRAKIAEYLPFAMGKALDHRGLSTQRSVHHITNWAWLGGLGDILAFAENDDNYPSYGVPILKFCAKVLGVEVPAEIENWPDGKPCVPNCTSGCCD